MDISVLLKCNRVLCQWCCTLKVTREVWDISLHLPKWASSHVPRTPEDNWLGKDVQVWDVDKSVALFPQTKEEHIHQLNNRLAKGRIGGRKEMPLYCHCIWGEILNSTFAEF